jgi:hypothetical protein
MAAPRKGVDLGQLQENMEVAAKNLTKAGNAYAKAKKVFEDSEEEYQRAKQSLVAGVDQLKASTKVN